jgi:hypothetical protein
LLAFALTAIIFSPLSAHTPESPKVQNSIKRGIAFLMKDDVGDSRPGGQALIGIALIKNGVPKDHPKVLKAVEAVKLQIPDNDPRKANIENIYAAGLSIIFLVELNPDKYRAEIDCLLKFLFEKQKKHGGWGYYEKESGDTSMTQYGVLSSWMAKQEGFDVPAYRMEDVADWLLRTQDPSGGYSYQGTVAPEGALVPQENDKIRESMSAAGGGSLFIIADMFEFDSAPKKKEEAPAALKVKADAPKRQMTRINPAKLHEAQSRVNEWMKKNYTISPKFGYNYYYLYALERYMSFRDLIEKTSEKEPKWYNDGVDYILAHQAGDGSCGEELSECGPAVDTSFAILFMNRAAKKLIEKAKSYGPGMLVGGRGLGGEKDSFELRNGQMVTKPLAGPAEDLLKMLDDLNAADYDQILEMMSELPSQKVETVLAAHGDKLRKLASGKEPEARMAAIVALGKTRSLDNVPALIYSLGKDEDREVVIEARKALERISRNPKGFGPQDDFNDEQRRAAVQKWKAWYLSLRPDAEVDF